MTTKKVVDASALRSPAFERYLEASSRNFAVITEFAVFEILKGNAELNLRRSVAIISRFPKQVIHLRSNAEISRMSLRRKGLQKRLQDEKQTHAFVDYCRTLQRSDPLEPSLISDITEKASLAKRYMERFTRQAESVRKGIAQLAARIAPKDLNALRQGLPASPAFTEQFVRDVMGVTALHFRDVVRPQRMPRADDALLSFPFRYAVCAYALTLRWLKEGGHLSAQASTLRNDYIDMSYAAYATFFDGLITKDKKLSEMYSISCWVLRNVFPDAFPEAR